MYHQGTKLPNSCYLKLGYIAASALTIRIVFWQEFIQVCSSDQYLPVDFKYNFTLFTKALILSNFLTVTLI